MKNYALYFKVFAQRWPDMETEYRFDSTRRWRFDLAWPPHDLAMEIEGGAWTKGRHTRGSGFVKDLEKYNEATAQGWRILRVTPQMLESGEAMLLLERILGR